MAHFNKDGTWDCYGCSSFGVGCDGYSDQNRLRECMAFSHDCERAKAEVGTEDYRRYIDRAHFLRLERHLSEARAFNDLAGRLAFTLRGFVHHPADPAEPGYASRMEIAEALLKEAEDKQKAWKEGR